VRGWGGTALLKAPAGAVALPIIASAGAKLGQVAEKFGTTASSMMQNVLANGQRYVDVANNGQVNVLLQRPDGVNGFVRITLDPTMQRVISAGLMRGNQVANGIASGRFIPLE
jgi:hypothetical protein